MMNDQDREAIWLVLLAAIGGLVGYLSKSLSSRQHVKGTIAAIKFVSSGFLGYVLVLICREYQISVQMTGVICSIFGWIGADAVVPIVEKISKRRLGIADDNVFYPTHDAEGRRTSDHVEVVIVKVSAAGKILEASQEVLNLFGRPKEYYIGMDHTVLIPHEHRKLHQAAFNLRVADPVEKAMNPFGRAVYIVHADGQRINCRVDIREEIEADLKVFYAYFSRRLQTPEQKFE